MSRRIWLIAAFSLVFAACNPGADGVTDTEPTLAPASQTPSSQTRSSPAPTVSPPSATSQPPGGYTPVFEDDTCDFDEPAGRAVRCGYVTVPENREMPDGRQVKLAVAIVEAQTPSGNDDPIIYLDGGPGGESLEPLQFAFAGGFEPFASTRDLIFFDQRGVGLSQPSLECTEDIDLTFELLDQDLPDSRFIELQREAIQQCHDRLVGDGIDLSQYNSPTNAADVADIRVALGFDEVNLLGISYGTRLAQTVMRDHPEGIRSVILDSVYTPDVDLISSTPANLDRALDELFAGCTGECLDLYPDLEQRFFDLIEELDRAPILVDVTDLIGGGDYTVIVDGQELLGVVFSGLYSELIIPVLPKVIDDVDNGSTAVLSQLLSINLANVPFLSFGMHLSVQCAEEIPFADPATVAAADDPFPEFGSFFETASNIGPLVFDLCEIWDVPALGAIENEAISSDIPTLVLAGEYDPITPPAWGELVTANLTNVEYLLAPGLGHGVSIGSSCTADISLAFIDNPKAPLAASCITALPAPPWSGTQAAVAGFRLVEVEVAGLGGSIVALRPDTWEQLQPGVYVRGTTALDQTALLIQTFPESIDGGDIAQLFGASLGSDGGLVELGEVDGWRQWQTVVLGFTLDLSVKTVGETQVLLGLISSEGEREFLIEAILQPVREALRPT